MLGNPLLRLISLVAPMLLCFSIPTYATPPLQRCLHACQKRQKQAHLRCLQLQATLTTTRPTCPLPQPQHCQTICIRYTARVRERERHLCARQYIKRMRQCQALRPPAQQDCQQAALRQKKQCLRSCAPPPPHKNMMRCLKNCSQYWSKQQLRCKRFRLTPRIRRRCEQRYREEHDRCVHLCEHPHFTTFDHSLRSPATSLPTKGEKK